MRGLIHVLTFKIVFTIVGACVPLLLLPASALQWIGFDVPQPILFLRMLGMAYAALIVGYAFGLRDAKRGIYPAQAVWVGIFSNGGAALILSFAALNGTWAHWGAMAQMLMWGSLISLTGITAGLISFGPFDLRIDIELSKKYAEFL
ncbi:hypothetical protein [Stenotrophobium rhamnosiphilum]|uniref:Uncharacterized protein n=1 Tax=Stenotrophobium rhamnosiphilum TaxID=2029166 RepID=A0A2T5MCA7_9GAMM|nr:hypothetical protein [Stenotrophobium rhamnosiphilum]PTU30203.1 hypothetical protein CJD38_16820 [Stenotrophobium rhamnosiphilum]